VRYMVYSASADQRLGHRVNPLMLGLIKANKNDDLPDGDASYAENSPFVKEG